MPVPPWTALRSWGDASRSCWRDFGNCTLSRRSCLNRDIAPADSTIQFQKSRETGWLMVILAETTGDRNATAGTGPTGGVRHFAGWKKSVRSVSHG